MADMKKTGRFVKKTAVCLCLTSLYFPRLSVTAPLYSFPYLFIYLIETSMYHKPTKPCCYGLSKRTHMATHRGRQGENQKAGFH